MSITLPALPVPPDVDASDLRVTRVRPLRGRPPRLTARRAARYGFAQVNDAAALTSPAPYMTQGIPPKRMNSRMSAP